LPAYGAIERTKSSRLGVKPKEFNFDLISALKIAILKRSGIYFKIESQNDKKVFIC